MQEMQDSRSIPGSGRPSGVGNGKPLQNSCLENSTDRGAWRTPVHGVTKSRTQLSTEHKERGQSLELRGLVYGFGKVGWISACVFRETGHPHDGSTEGQGQSEAEQERFRESRRPALSSLETFSCF